jgi:hypothetical protein
MMRYLKDLLAHAPYAPTQQAEFRAWSKQFAHWLFSTGHISVRYEPVSPRPSKTDLASMPPRAVERELAELERRLPPARPKVPPEIQAFLAGLSCDQLRHLERVLERWPDGTEIPLDLAQAIVDVGEDLSAHGLELALQSARRFTPAEFEAMSPRERAEAYRALIHTGGEHA